MTAHRSTALIWLALSGGIIFIDQWSKAWVLAYLPEYTAVPVIHGLWNWYRTYNTGAAFSFLSRASGWQMWVLSGFALIVSALIIQLWRINRRQFHQAVPYALVIGGAVSNVIDRYWRGHVIDFIQWYVGHWYWPAFNLADSAIVIGALWLAIVGVTERAPGQTNIS